MYLEDTPSTISCYFACWLGKCCGRILASTCCSTHYNRNLYNKSCTMNSDNKDAVGCIIITVVGFVLFAIGVGTIGDFADDVIGDGAGAAFLIILILLIIGGSIYINRKMK